MYKIIKRLHVIECDCCGDAQVVDDETLLEMFLNGDVAICNCEEECECDEDCETCGFNN